MSCLRRSRSSMSLSFTELLREITSGLARIPSPGLARENWTPPSIAPLCVPFPFHSLVPVSPSSASSHLGGENGAKTPFPHGKLPGKSKLEKWWARRAGSLSGDRILVSKVGEARAERHEQERHQEVYLIRVAMAGAGEVERTDYTPKSSFADDLRVLRAMWFGSVSGDSHQDQLESFYNKQVRTRPRPPRSGPRADRVAPVPLDFDDRQA